MLKSIRHSIRRLSQPSRDRGSNLLLLGLKMSGRSRKDKALSRKRWNMSYMTLHIRKDWAVPLSVPFSMP
jgi:hypothetical protein